MYKTDQMINKSPKHNLISTQICVSIVYLNSRERLFWKDSVLGKEQCDNFVFNLRVVGSIKHPTTSCKTCWFVVFLTIFLNPISCGFAYYV